MLKTDVNPSGPTLSFFNSKLTGLELGQGLPTPPAVTHCPPISDQRTGGGVHFKMGGSQRKEKPGAGMLRPSQGAHCRDYTVSTASGTDISRTPSDLTPNTLGFPHGSVSKESASVEET